MLIVTCKIVADISLFFCFFFVLFFVLFFSEKIRFDSSLLSVAVMTGTFRVRKTDFIKNYD